jgi:HSP20 family protein
MLLTTLNNIDDVFDNFFTARPYEFRPFNKSSNHKIEHDDDGATLTLNVPGYNKKLIDVSVDGEYLIIEGKPNSGNTNGFTRKFNLNDSFDADGIEATVVDGVLTLSIPYLEEVKPKKVNIKVK